jgi:hypothetical protein
MHIGLLSIRLATTPMRLFSILQTTVRTNTQSLSCSILRSVPRFLVQLQKTSALPKVIVSNAVFVIKLELCQSVFMSHLGKPYTLNSVTDDWSFERKGITVQRPNHGLAHTLRTIAYLPLCARLFLQHNALNPVQQSQIFRAIPMMQLGLLFYIAGRENEANSFDDPAAYNGFRLASTALFRDHVTKEGVNKAESFEAVAKAVKERGYQPLFDWAKILVRNFFFFGLLRFVVSHTIFRLLRLTTWIFCDAFLPTAMTAVAPISCLLSARTALSSSSKSRWNV